VFDGGAHEVPAVIPAAKLPFAEWAWWPVHVRWGSEGHGRIARRWYCSAALLRRQRLAVLLMAFALSRKPW